jgi:hypothetical protein
MKSLALAVAFTGLLSTSVFSAPLFNQQRAVDRPSLVTDVKVVCEQNGVCYRPPGRHPVARWIYGDDSFYGPYDGVHYYGAPGRRYKWSFFSPWNW